MRQVLVWLSLAATTTAAAVVQAQQPEKHFLWSVTAPGAPPSYLMGSLHVLTPDYYPLSPRIEQAFDASSVLIVETDLDDLTNPAILAAIAARALLPDGQTLADVIAPALHARVMERADRAGVPRAALARMKPWMVSLTLTAPALQAAGFGADNGVDKHFFDRAKTAGKSRRALETVEYQLGRLDGMSSAEQEALLRSTIDEIDTEIAQVRTIANAWARGDTASLEKLLLASTKSSPELYQRLIVERNEAWVASVQTCLKERTPCFVVVGAAHLVGPDSLVSMLRRKGYAVEQQ